MGSELMPFINLLVPDALTTYPELPALLHGFESALDEVIRAASMHSQIWKKPNETVLDHLGGEHGILPITIMCFNHCPTLATELKVRSIVAQIFVHDWPETVVQDHDHATTKPHKHHLDGRKDRAERIAFHLFLLPLITNPQLAEEISNTFNEFMDNETTEAIFTHLMDRLAGNWAVNSQHLNRILEKDGRPMGMDADRIDEHVSRHASEVSQLSLQFADRLSPEAHREWWLWFEATFKRVYTSTGHDKLPRIDGLFNQHETAARAI